MNTLPDEVKEKAKKRFPFEDGAYPSHDACTNARREGFIAGWEEYAKVYAPVPGKEESYWQRRCEAAELIIGISGTVDCEGYEQWETLKEQEPASPSTASNEDKLTAQEYHKLIQGDFDKSYDEPKAVQAAKEYAIDRYPVYPIKGNNIKWLEYVEDLRAAFIAGASFNSDAVEKTNDEFCICMFRTTSIKGERCGYCLKIVNG